MRLCINPGCQNSGNPDNLMSCQECQSDLLIDGQYVVRKLIDEGGFGRIYEVEDQESERILKILARPDDTKAKDLFLLEKTILEDRNITGVPKLFDYFEYTAKDSDQNIPCIVMQKIEGLNLEKWLHERNDKPINPNRALNWLKQLSHTLHLIHQKGYFHRDIKPSNIMLNNDGQLILIDFGIGRRITDTLPEKIESRSVTKYYSEGYAPLEQEVGKASPQSDFFALGRTFIHLLTGKHPDDMADSYRSANTDDNWDWRSETQDCPELLLDFIDFLSDKSDQKRPKDTAELLEKLNNLEEELFPPSNNQVPIYINTQSEGLKLKEGKISIFGDLSSRHSQSVTTLAISADDKVLISGSRDRNLKIWNAASGQLIKTLPAVHGDSISSVQISPKLKYFASGSSDKYIKVWDYSNYQNIINFHHPGIVTALTIDPSGATIASACSDGHIRLWELTSTKATHQYRKTSSTAKSLAITPSGKALVSGHEDRTINVWQFFELTAHSNAVSALAISSDSKFLVSGSQDDSSGEIFVWDFSTKGIIQKFIGHTGAISSLVICPENHFVVSTSCSDQEIKLWDMNSGKEAASISAHTDGINTLAITSDGKTIYSGSRDFSIRSWDIV